MIPAPQAPAKLRERRAATTIIAKATISVSRSIASSSSGITAFRFFETNRNRLPIVPVGTSQELPS
jgi:hypothetical protein